MKKNRSSERLDHCLWSHSQKMVLPPKRGTWWELCIWHHFHVKVKEIAHTGKESDSWSLSCVTAQEGVWFPENLLYPHSLGMATGGRLDSHIGTRRPPPLARADWSRRKHLTRGWSVHCPSSNLSDFPCKFEIRCGNWSKLILGPWPKWWVRMEKKTEVGFAVCLLPSCPDGSLVLRPGWEMERGTGFETEKRDCWTCTLS